MPYEKNQTYQRNDVMDALGAENAHPLYALHRAGHVLALTVNRWQNPNAPAEILVGFGQNRETLAASFIQHQPTVPVFIKEDRTGTQWHYAGTFKLKSHTADPAETHKRVQPPHIPSIYKILFLEEVQV